MQAAASALEAKVALLDANHIEHIDARLQVGAISKNHKNAVLTVQADGVFDGVLMEY